MCLKFHNFNYYKIRKSTKYTYYFYNFFNYYYFANRENKENVVIVLLNIWKYPKSVINSLNYNFIKLTNETRYKLKSAFENWLTENYNISYFNFFSAESKQTGYDGG